MLTHFTVFALGLRILTARSAERKEKIVESARSGFVIIKSQNDEVSIKE